MKIDFESSGGFANLMLEYRANTEDLPAELGEELRDLVESAGVFDIRAEEVAPTQAGQPDVIQYQLSVTEGSRQTTITCNDVTAPPSLRPLLSRLRELAIQQRRE
ncbi:MAG TPA: protealysin inhibitor emfourin [Anaerolineales bacterium]